MALEPQLILLDEPMAGMNFEEKEDMARYIVDLNEEFGMTVMMIEHDMGVVMDISHRVMVLDFGRKIAEGDPAAVLADPARQARLSRRRGRVWSIPTTSRPRGDARHDGLCRPRRPGRHLSEAAAPQRQRAWRRDRAARKGFRAVARVHLERLSDPRARVRAGHGRARPRPRRRHRHHRRQPAGLGRRPRSPPTPSAP